MGQTGRVAGNPEEDHGQAAALLDDRRSTPEAGTGYTVPLPDDDMREVPRRRQNGCTARPGRVLGRRGPACLCLCLVRSYTPVSRRGYAPAPLRAHRIRRRAQALPASTSIAATPMIRNGPNHVATTRRALPLSSKFFRLSNICAGALRIFLHALAAEGHRRRRSLLLQEALHASVPLFKADPRDRAGDVAALAQKRLGRAGGIDPLLPRAVNALRTDPERRPAAKERRHRVEMTRFRYDVIIARQAAAAGVGLPGLVGATRQDSGRVPRAHHNAPDHWRCAAWRMLACRRRWQLPAS